MAKTKKTAAKKQRRTATEVIGEDFLYFRELVSNFLPIHFRSQIPSWLLIFKQVKDLRIVENFSGGDPQLAPSDSDITDEIYCAFIHYKIGQFYEKLIAEQTADTNVPPALDRFLRKRGSLRDSRPEKIAEKKAHGEPYRYPKKNQKIADTALAVSCWDLLKRLRPGSNESYGWDNWYEDAKDLQKRRRPSAVQKLFERLLLIIDPERLLPDAPVNRRPPKSGFYASLKARYGG